MKPEHVLELALLKYLDSPRRHKHKQIIYKNLEKEIKRQTNCSSKELKQQLTVFQEKGYITGTIVKLNGMDYGLWITVKITQQGREYLYGELIQKIKEEREKHVRVKLSLQRIKLVS